MRGTARIERQPLVRSAKRPHRRPRAVRGKFKDRHFAAESPHPVVGAGRFLRRASRGLADVLGVRHDLGQYRRQTVVIGGVKRGEILQDETRRPAVADQMMRGEHHHVDVIGLADDMHPCQRPGGEIERLAGFARQQLGYGTLPRPAHTQMSISVIKSRRRATACSSPAGER